MKILIGIQARSNSTRLTGKIYEKIGNSTMLEHVYYRCVQAKCLDKAVKVDVKILGVESDTRLKTECESLGLECLLLNLEEDKVLDRYLLASKDYDAVIRVTSDCPYIPQSIVSDVIKGLCESDFVSNCIIRSFFEGADVQGCSRSALQWLYEYENKEHPFKNLEANEELRNKFIGAGFTIKHILNKDNEIFIKTSIDTMEELIAARNKYEKRARNS